MAPKLLRARALGAKAEQPRQGTSYIAGTRRERLLILKPKHSGFYETALPTLLHQLKVRRLALVGIAGDACVMATAMDANIRDFHVWVPADGTASQTTVRNIRALDFHRESVQCDVKTIQAAIEGTTDYGIARRNFHDPVCCSVVGFRA